jgi:hypothetical protein
MVLLWVKFRIREEAAIVDVVQEQIDAALACFLGKIARDGSYLSLLAHIFLDTLYQAVTVSGCEHSLSF